MSRILFWSIVLFSTGQQALLEPDVNRYGKCITIDVQTGSDMTEAQLAELQVLRGRIVEAQALQVFCLSLIGRPLVSSMHCTSSHL